MKKRPLPTGRDILMLKHFIRKTPAEVSAEEVAYFREHPEEIDELED